MDAPTHSWPWQDAAFQHTSAFHVHDRPDAADKITGLGSMSCMNPETIQTGLNLAASGLSLVTACIGAFALKHRPRSRSLPHPLKVLDSAVDGSNMKDPNKHALRKILLESMSLEKRNTLLCRVSSFLLGALLIVLGVVLIASVLGMLSTPQSRVSHALASYDPEVFSESNDGLYDFSRVIVNEQALRSETDLAETLNRATESWDLLTFSADVTGAFRAPIENALKRGCSIRIVLFDPGVPSYEFMVSLLDESKELKIEAARATLDQVLKLQEQIQDDSSAPTSQRTFRSGASIELRWLKHPLLHSMWIRDAGTEHCIAHISPYSYRGDEHSSSFRIGKGSPDLGLSLSADFQHLWTCIECTSDDPSVPLR